MSRWRDHSRNVILRAIAELRARVALYVVFTLAAAQGAQERVWLLRLLDRREATDAEADRLIREQERLLGIYQRAAGELSREAIIKSIDRAYPFGERKYLPYKMWLEARREVIADLDGGQLAVNLNRRCPACGAKPGKPCRPFGDEQVSNMHESRRVSGVRT